MPRKYYYEACFDEDENAWTGRIYYYVDNGTREVTHYRSPVVLTEPEVIDACVFYAEEHGLDIELG